jgi:hypothetical protein
MNLPKKYQRTMGHSYIVEPYRKVLNRSQFWVLNFCLQEYVKLAFSVIFEILDTAP